VAPYKVTQHTGQAKCMSASYTTCSI